MKLRYWGSMPEADQVRIAALITIGSGSSVTIEVEYIDVLSNVERAQAESVYITPTLERLLPEPEVRLIAIPEDAAKVFEKIRA